MFNLKLWQAHSSAIKCLVIDPNEEYFVTGSADGDIKVRKRKKNSKKFDLTKILNFSSFDKVWGLTVHTSLYSFPAEHPRSSIFKTQGVTQLHIDPHGRLFSCGADGTMKVRQLPDRESIVHSLY
jgi:DmX-like protein